MLSENRRKRLSLQFYSEITYWTINQGDLWNEPYDRIKKYSFGKKVTAAQKYAHALSPCACPVILSPGTGNTGGRARALITLCRCYTISAARERAWAHSVFRPSGALLSSVSDGRRPHVALDATPPHPHLRDGDDYCASTCPSDLPASGPTVLQERRVTARDTPRHWGGHGQNTEGTAILRVRIKQRHWPSTRGSHPKTRCRKLFSFFVIVFVIRPRPRSWRASPATAVSGRTPRKSRGVSSPSCRPRALHRVYRSASHVHAKRRRFLRHRRVARGRGRRSRDSCTRVNVLQRRRRPSTGPSFPSVTRPPSLALSSSRAQWGPSPRPSSVRSSGPPLSVSGRFHFRALRVRSPPHARSEATARAPFRSPGPTNGEDTPFPRT